MLISIHFNSVISNSVYPFQFSKLFIPKVALIREIISSFFLRDILGFFALAFYCNASRSVFSGQKQVADIATARPPTAVI